jgi:ketosteroid isomerase-like protein
MPGTNVDLVRSFLERFNREPPEEAVEALAEDFVAEVPPSLSAEPDVYEGREGALRYMRGFDGMLEDVRFEALDFHEEGEQVIVEMLLVGRGVSSGIEVEQPVALIVWVEDGLVKRMEPKPDLESARKRLRGG